MSALPGHGNGGRTQQAAKSPGVFPTLAMTGFAFVFSVVVLTIIVFAAGFAAAAAGDIAQAGWGLWEDLVG